ncbi:MAG: hypothetical protein LBM98_02195 [Oscillospiraceae bacterium]|jgi:hypothetical protein|nr:hypothetical protein [Oscillospiraceae bacterium]
MPTIGEIAIRLARAESYRQAITRIDEEINSKPAPSEATLKSLNDIRDWLKVRADKDSAV